MLVVKTDERLLRNLFTGSVAKSAKHALVGIVLDNVGNLDKRSVMNLTREITRTDIVLVCVLYELTVIVVMTTALKATRSLCLCLLLGKSEVYGIKVMLSCFWSKTRHLFT